MLTEFNQLKVNIVFDSLKDDNVKEFEQLKNNDDMYKQYSMDMVKLDSTVDRGQDIGLRKFIGVDGVEGDVDRVSDTRDGMRGLR
ncbi:hypothetical protein V6N13_137240 [Hibiscus sabdariffa]|uniref:Uncharacterized protein n=1 Tax=Hibiscus sabdariffa TaxID=183260 RepID=A0ABR2DL96_9ROSI